MGKKAKLTVDYTPDFDLIGIVCSMKEYKLAWNLNELGIFHLVKGEDVKIEFADKKIMRISALVEESEFTTVHLLRNKLLSSGITSSKYLLPEVQQFDYILKIRSTLEDNFTSKALTRIKECTAVDYAVLLDVNRMKAKENLIF